MAESSLKGNMSGPDLAGKVMTVNGPVDPETLGIVLMHEHLFIAMSRGGKTSHAVMPGDDSPAADFSLWGRELALDILHLVGDRRAVRDNWLLADEGTVIEEVLEFRHRGGGTLVEVTSKGIRRDPMAVRRVSQATGLNVVMGTGWYQEIYHPSDMDDRSVEELSQEMIGDIFLGISGTGIRSGIIGEIGTEGGPISANEEKSVRASGQAGRATGASITLHRGGVGREKLEVVRMLKEEGADPSRVVFGHSDPIAGDIPLLLELLESGVNVEFDLLGRLGVPLVPMPATDDFSRFFASPGTAVVANAIPRLIDAGYAGRILFSHDVATKVQLKRYGGNGYSFILERFLPHLRTIGVEEEHIRMITVENPRLLLTFGEPRI